MLMRAAGLALALLLVGATFKSGGLAVFTDAQTVDANAFTVGTLDISTAPTTALVTYAGMAPGDAVTSSIVVSNTGTLALRYTVRASATNPDTKALKDQLTLTIRTIDVTSPGTPCNDFDGTQLYAGDLDGTAGQLVGDNAQGAQAGDRTLAVAASEMLCFRVALPLTTDSSFQGATTTATFTFDAEQTANN